MKKSVLIILGLCVSFAAFAATFPWEHDFARQPIEHRPRLEVRYTDGSRMAFEIDAAEYHLIGELTRPHRLLDPKTQAEWLGLTVTGPNAVVYMTQNAEPASRINLYRRGPYFCEVHWLDIQVADENGNPAPLKGDLALYCYPDKLLASITWHGTDAFDASEVAFHGIAKRAFAAEPFAKGGKQSFACPLFGETDPLPASAFENLNAVAPMRYDAVRGCYTIGSFSTGGFQGHFFRHPNRYETVEFSVTNDDQPRTLYVCQENTGGDKGTVEGGVLLDDAGHPLPITVQISKNFAGEKEEKFYNPTDTSFSETYFPLRLQPNEKRTLTSLHLYQNWGRHMVKQFSSLGAWMDYFHSSTGVTETTCYVPFKFGALPGVAIADYRAMSQSSFWGGQPQHDNIAGHSFLSYKTGAAWQYMVYRGTTYRSTGPNWMDIGLAYESTDGKIRTIVDTFELPQADELRNFIRVRCDVLQPVTIENAKENFRLLTIASWVQSLRYTHFAATGIDDQPLTFPKGEGGLFSVSGQHLPDTNAFIALYGERKGSNAFVLRNWSATVNGQQIGPAASVLCEKKGDTRLILAPDAENLELKPGDRIEFDGFWFCYGATDTAEAARRETRVYGSEAPRITAMAQGEKLADFPPTLRATNDNAEFTLQGGRDVVPVIVTGLTDYRWPRIERKQEGRWNPIRHGRNSELDGVQVFAESDSRFGAVFLVHSDNSPQVLRITVGKEPEPVPKISVKPKPAGEGDLHHAALIQAPWMKAPIRLRFPETLHTDALDFIDHRRDDMPPRVDPQPLSNVWEESEAGSLWFEWSYDNQIAGGRLTPNEDDVDLEFWLGNNRKSPVNVGLQFCPMLGGTLFEDHALERTWIYTDGAWKKMAETDRGDKALCHYPVAGGPPVNVPPPWGNGGEVADLSVVAVTSEDGQYVFAIAWPNARSILSNAHIPCVHADPMLPACPPGRRIHVRGKVYLMKGTLNDLANRVRREVLENGIGKTP